MNKLILILSVFIFASCSGMKDKKEQRADNLMYDKADPTEEIRLADKSQKEMLAREKAEQGFNMKRFFQTLMSNKSPNRLVPEFPELLRNNHIDNETVFRSF